MSWLKTLGQIIATGTKLWLGFSQVANIPGGSGTIATVTKDLTEVANIVAAVEAVGHLQGLTGQQKLVMAQPQVAQIILSSAILANHQIADPVLFKSATEDYVNATVKLLNSLKGNPAILDKMTTA